MQENKDYVLIPADGIDNNDQAWDIRITSGEFVETVVRFGNVAINGEENVLNFNFTLISSPDEDLTEDSIELQKVVGDILHDVVERAVKENYAVIDEKKNK